MLVEQLPNAARPCPFVGKIAVQSNVALTTDATVLSSFIAPATLGSSNQHGAAVHVENLTGDEAGVLRCRGTG